MGKQNDTEYEVHLVSHTHWDREWYSTFQEFRIRLVKMFDKLLHTLDTEPDYKYFVFDGQTIILEDYLEIRPENREKLCEYIRSGRISVGPWYVQPDEFLVSGESIIRNLMIGHKIAGEFGNVMKVGYQPDPFGHIAQLPQIFQGFGIGSAMFMRGLGKEVEEHGLEFIWRAPDGSSVLAIFQLPTDTSGGYTNAASLGYPNYRIRVNFDIRLALEKSKDLVERLKRLARTKYLLFNNGGDQMEPQAELPAVINYLNDHLENVHVIHSTFADYLCKIEMQRMSLATYEGELRKARYMPLLVNVLSARMYAKQKNFSAQNAIEKYAEPLASFAYLEGKEYPDNLLWQSWKYLVQTHAHDTICGCSIDKVHDEAMQRADWSQQISHVIIRESMEHLVYKHTSFQEDPCVAVFNTLPWQRTEEVVINNIKYEVNAPACGYEIFDIAELKKPEIRLSGYNDRVLENAFVKVEAAPNGTLIVTDKTTGLVYENLNYFEDVEDCGDEYNYSPAEVSNTITTLHSMPSIENRDGMLIISYDLHLPISIVEVCKRRSEDTIVCSLVTTVTLSDSSPIVKIKTQFHNCAKDHRLRVGFNPGIKAEYSLAEGQYQVVKRPLEINQDDWVLEYPTGDFPQQNFVIIENDQKGMIVANKGLPEYQLTKDGRLYITLVRCVEWINALGWMNRKVRQEPSNRMGFSPGAQCLGEYTYEYAILPFSGMWEDKLRDIYNYIVPLTLHEMSGAAQAKSSYFSLESRSMLISAIKKAQCGKNLIIRVFNITDKKVTGYLYTFREPSAAYLVKLNEERIQQIPTDERGILLSIEPCQIVTIEIAFDIL